MGSTNIPVSETVADLLHDAKQRGETYDDVLRRKLDLEDELEADA
jgi:hypothetical protein